MLRVYVKVPAAPVVGIDPVKYGLYYNWYAVTDAREITISDWKVPELSEIITLDTYLLSNKGGKLKETGLIHWDSPNLGATNEVMFNLRGSGYRNYATTFGSIGATGYFWVTDEIDASNGRAPSCNSTTGAFSLYSGMAKKNAAPIRPVKITTALADGETSTMIGNDGKVYRTICINGVEWLADNLAETKFRNGDYIHGYELGVYTPIANVDWAALTTEGCCAYNDDTANI